MEIIPGSIPWQSFYKLMIGTIVPRPIGWISSLSTDGTPNLAPFSFFNAVCSNPPHVLFCASMRAAPRPDSGLWKDTLHNVRETGEFVVNIVTEALAEAMNITSGEYARGQNEFEIAGVTARPSVLVKPPKVAESPVHYECVVSHIIDVSDQPGGASVVIGRVVHMDIADELIIGGDRVDILKLKPVGRLAGTGYARVNDLFDMARPRVDPNPSSG